MEIGFLNEVKAILKSLVLSCTDKITIDKLNRDYREIEGKDIPFRRLGYNNLEQFLRQIPDTLTIVGTGHSAVVYFVGNGKSAHIHNMIMTQKKARPRSRGKANKRVNFTPANAARDRGRINNRFPANVNPSRRMPGQQLSAFEITNRNVSTRTVTVRDIPPQHNLRPPMNQNVRPTINPAIGNNRSLMDVLPQPSGIVKTFQQMTVRSTDTAANTGKTNPIKTTINPQNDAEINKKYQEHIKQLESLMNSSCLITTPKTVSFSPETRAEKLNSNAVTPKACASATPLAGINPPKPKVRLSVEAERILSATTLAKKVNPIQVEQANEAYLEEKKSPPKAVKKTESTNNNFKKLMDIYEENVDDLDEAVPQFAANSRVFRLDWPKYTVPYGRKIDPCEMPDDIEVGTCLGVFISEIHNPFRFWFHIHKEQHELDILMHQIERYYTTMDSNDLRIPVICLNPGQICAASFNGMWHRGEIVAPPVNNKVKVSFIDYGTVSDVDIADVKYLGLCFSQLPAQALRGCLSNIKPRGLHWSHDATTYFLSVVSELMLYAKITEIDRENKVFYMILCDTHGDKVLQINKNLVEKKFALYNEEWQETKIQKNNGLRIRHPREDFPTFSMIESGEYPSFMELVELQLRGIDYELIYDRIIFNKCAVLNTYDNVPEPIRKLPFFLLTNNPFRADIIFELTSGMKTTI